MKHFKTALVKIAVGLCLTAVSPVVHAQNDDDILSPADDDALFPEAGPAKVQKLGIKLGFFPFISLGEPNQKLGQEISQGLRTELRAIGVETYKLRLPKAQKARASGNVKISAHRQKYKAAKNFLRRGKKSLKKLRFRSANKSFRKAIQHFEAGVGAMDSVDEVVEAYLGLAESAARQGIENKAVKYLQSVASLAPEMRMDDSLYPPPFIRTYQQVKYDLFKEGFSSLLIDETGAGAEVSIDGQVLGNAPLRVSGLPMGPHFVKVTSTKGVFAKVVDLSDGELALSPKLIGGGASGPTEEISNNQLSAASAKKLGNLAARSGMQYAAVGVFANQDGGIPTSMMIIRPKDGKVLRVSTLAFDGDLLNLSIEAVVLVEAVQSIKNGAEFSDVGSKPFLRGFNNNASVELTERQMRYRAKKPRRKLAGKKSSGRSGRGRASLSDNDGEDDERIIESGGGSGRRTSLLDDDSEDPLGRTPRRNMLSESDEVPLMEQAWFWPTVIGGGSALVLVGGTTLLIGTGVVPNPLPKDSVAVEVTLPQ